MIALPWIEDYELKQPMNRQEFDRIYDQLTDRRQQVLNRLLAGESDRQIADSLGISQATVRKHIERIAGNFGLSNLRSPDTLRRFKRPELVSLIGRFRPELVKVPVTKLSQQRQKRAVANVLKDIQCIPSIHHSLEAKLRVLQDNISSTQKIELARELYTIGDRYYQQGDFHSASIYLQWSVQFNPQSPAACCTLGAACEQLGHLSLAYTHYQQAAQQDYPIAIDRLARLEILLGQPESAIARISAILDRNNAIPTDLLCSLYTNLGWACWLTKDCDRAETLLYQAIALNGDRPIPHCLLAQVLETKGKPQAAGLHWQHCLSCENNTAKAPPAPELLLWQQQARQFLNCDRKNPPLLH